MSKAADGSMAFMPAKIRLEQASQAIDGYLEKYFWRLASVFSIVLFIYLIWKDLHLKLWLDELNTVYITKQNGPVEIIKATAEGTDAAPPLEIIHFYERFIKIPILLALVTMIASFVFRDNLYANNSGRRHFLSYELAAILCISLAPAAIVILSMFTTHVFVYRYCIWAVIGLGLLAAILLHEVGRAQAVIGVTALGVLISSIAVKEMASLGKIGQLREGEAIQRALANLPDNGEAIVVPDAHAFLELSYYGNPELKKRLVYPASPELDARYLGYDTEPLVLETLAPRTNLHVQNYEQFISEHKRFILAINHKDYLEWVLLKSGYSVVPVDSDARLPVIFTAETGKP